ncbi:aspartate/glutamate racemase family protein [Nocardia testacea]|uniref:Aspartate/glutamate racemase family protein n=1 Tax=Nocardia testacea TaxID=248551 RepID=A0ABW7VPX3_9NOCA
MTDNPVIAVVHSTIASIAPTKRAFAREMPRAQLWNLLDDRLGADADDLGIVAPHLRRRMLDLIRHGIDGGADAVLMACSMYGDTAAVAEQLWTVPVFSSDSDMFDELARLCPARVAVLASLEASAADSTARLRAYLANRDIAIQVVSVFCPGAAAAAAEGDYVQMVKALAAGLDGRSFDVVVLAQYSLSPATDDLAEATGLPVLSAPQLAARAVREQLGGRS